MNKILSTALLGALLVGCAQEKAESRFPEIQFGSQIDVSAKGDAVSRAVSVNDTPLTGVSFLRQDGALAPTSFAGAELLTASRATGGAITFAAPVPIYALTDLPAFFVAYHPAGVVASKVATWTIDGKTDILLTPIYNAGKYTAPLTGTMTFKHQLAQLAVVCKADASAATAEAAVQAVWGNITKIELLETPTTRIYTYATNAVTNGTTLGALPLLNNNYESTFVAVPITKNATNVVTAAGMFAPAASGTAPLKLKVYTTTEPSGKEVSVQLVSGGNKSFEMGLCHTVTLEFLVTSKNINVLATTVDAWGTGYTGSGTLTK